MSDYQELSPQQVEFLISALETKADQRRDMGKPAISHGLTEASSLLHKYAAYEKDEYSINELEEQE